MARKIEDWSQVFRSSLGRYSQSPKRSIRDRIIEGCALLDIALAHLLEKRLLDMPKDIIELLGLDDNGRAPVKTFGARIQLALLTGAIQPRGAKALRALKNIRNEYAHRVEVDLSKGKVASELDTIYESLKSLLKATRDTPEAEKLIEDGFGSYKSSDNAASKMLSICLIMFQAILDDRIRKVTRIECVNVAGTF